MQNLAKFEKFYSCFESVTDHMNSTISSEDFIDFDIEVSTSHGRLTTVDIIADITEAEDEEFEVDDEDDKDEDKLTRPTADQVRSAITVLEVLSSFSKFGEDMIVLLKNLNHNINKDHDFICKQKVITDFFS